MLNENEVRESYEKFWHDAAIKDDIYVKISFMASAITLGYVLQIPVDKILENINSYNTASGGVANDG